MLRIKFWLGPTAHIQFLSSELYHRVLLIKFRVLSQSKYAYQPLKWLSSPAWDYTMVMMWLAFLHLLLLQINKLVYLTVAINRKRASEFYTGSSYI